MSKTQRLPKETLEPAARAELTRILSKQPHELTEVERVFLRARSAYLTEEEERRYFPEPAKKKKQEAEE